MENRNPNVVEDARNALQKYEDTGVLELPNEIHETDFGVWAVVFQEHIDDAWKAIRIFQIKSSIKNAQESVRQFNEDPKCTEKGCKALERVIASLAMAQMGWYEYSDHPSFDKVFVELLKETVTLWFNAFDSDTWQEAILNLTKTYGHEPALKILLELKDKHE